MRALAAAVVLLAVLGTPASARMYSQEPGAWTVAPATSADMAAENVRALALRLFDAQKKADAAAYSAARLGLLENLALLQEWALRSEDPATMTRPLEFELTADGKKALGTRKPRAADFVSRSGATPRPRAPLDFKP